MIDGMEDFVIKIVYSSTEYVISTIQDEFIIELCQRELIFKNDGK